MMCKKSSKYVRVMEHNIQRGPEEEKFLEEVSCKKMKMENENFKLKTSENNSCWEVSKKPSDFFLLAPWVEPEKPKGEEDGENKDGEMAEVGDVSDKDL